MYEKTELNQNARCNMQNAMHHTPQQTEVTQLLKSYLGITQRIGTIFNYHYDAIQRDIQQELQHLPANEQNIIIDMVIAYMEDILEIPRFTNNNQVINTICNL